MKNRLLLTIFAFVACLLFSKSTYATSQVDKFITLTEDGAWCWFADPRAVYYEGEKKQTYIGWINSQGDIMVASYNHETNEYMEKTIHSKLEIDDHDVPALLIRKDGRIVVFYSKHQSAGPMQRVISTNPEDISSFSSSYTWGANVSYPNPFQVGDSICLLYRGINWHPTIAVSTDDGKTFTDVRQLVLNGGARPYARYCQGADGSLHVAVTTGHPRNEAQNKIYYFQLKDNKFYRADGTLIKPFSASGIDLGNGSAAQSEAEIVYDGVSNGRGWIWDITIDPETQKPVMVYASFPTESDHRYNYAYWDGEKWVNKEIVNSGKWFPQTPNGTTEREPHYSGGLSMDHDNPSVVYLSKQVNNVFEIYKYETNDKGTTWTATAVTENTPSDIVNVRPIVPRNHQEGYFDVIWMRGKYGYYLQDFKTSLVFQMSKKTDNIESIRLNHTTLEMSVNDVETLTAVLSPLFSNQNLIWSSSDENVAVVNGDGAVTALSIGTTEITAETVNGKKAICEVTVKEQEYLTEGFFDFGTSTSPVASGAIQVTETTLLKGTYGWLSEVISRNRGSGNDEQRDFNMNSANTTFRVYVEDGTYDVKILQGDQDYGHDKMRVAVNGEVKLSAVTCAKGKFITSEFEVKVENKQMNFEFSRHGSDPNWVINSIRFKRQPETALSEIENDENLFCAGTVMTVFDIIGKKVGEYTLDSADYLSLLKNKGISSGIYLLHLQNNKQKKVLKVQF